MKTILSVYIDSLLSNADLIHKMCLLNEQSIRRQSFHQQSQNQARNSSKNIKKSKLKMSIFRFYKTILLKTY